jgi:hypothetical protein
MPLGAGATVIIGPDQAAHGWSTMKIPVIIALIRAQHGLTASQQQLAAAAITESDNAAILDLFADLERLEGGLVGASNYIDAILRDGGDASTYVATAPPPPGAVTTFGQTEWAPSQAVRFFGALGRGCLLPTSETHYLLSLMESIEPSESWGLGSAGFTAPVAFKGGWGPEPAGSYLVRQSGIIDVGSRDAVAVAIVAFPPGSGETSFVTGTEMLTTTARWLSHELVLSPHAALACRF